MSERDFVTRDGGTVIALPGLPPPPPPPPPFYLRARLAQGADYHAGSVMLAALVREAQSPTIGKAA